MKIIVGLGNPGPRYETTRHNVGFLALDRMVDDWRATGPSSSHEAEIWQASIAGEKVLLVKPQTFMNQSGRTVGPLMKFYKCAPEDLLVLHDELDLPPRAIRIKTGGGTGGHNGLKSIDAHLQALGPGASAYHRIRIGIGRPGAPGVSTRVRETVDYVLEPFSEDELAGLDPLLDRVKLAAERIVRGDVKGAMTEFNRKPETAGSDSGGER